MRLDRYRSLTLLVWLLSVSAPLAANAQCPVISYAGSPFCSDGGTATVSLDSPVPGGIFSAAPGLSINSSSGDIDLAASTPGTYTVIYSYTDPGGCPQESAETSITVNATPSVVEPADLVVCAGQATGAIQFTGDITGTTFTWTNNEPSIGLAANGSGDINSFTAVNNGASPVVATVSVTPSANGCVGDPQIFTITVNPTPTVSDPADQAVCNGGLASAIDFSGSVSGTSYNWTNDQPSIGLAASGSGNIAAFNAINNGNTPVVATITVTPIAASCPGTQQTFTITVDPTPSVTDPADQVVCNSETTAAVNFSGAVAGTNYSWTNSNTTIGLPASGSGNIGAFAAINNGTTPVVATITVTPTASSCPGTQQTFTITVDPTPSVTDPADQVVCNSETTAAVNFSGAVAGTNYSWTNSNTSIGLPASGSGNIGAFAAINNGTTPVVATITVIPTANSCPGTQQTFTITVNPTPSVTDPADQVVCNGEATMAVNFAGGVTGTTYSWTNDEPSIGLGLSGNGNIGSFVAVNNGNAPVTATITVTPSANGCSGSPEIFTITVNPTPSVTDPADQVICNSASTTAVNFTGVVPGTIFSWTNNNTTIGLAASGTGNIGAFTATNNGTTPVVATITVVPSANGCAGPAQNFTITVNPTPDVGDPVDQIVCNGGPTAAVNFAGGVGGTTYSWTNDQPSIGLSANGTGNIASFVAVNNGTATVIATITVTPSASTCSGSTQSFTITVNPTPNVADPADQVVCNGAPVSAVNFTSAVAGTTYSWTNNNTSIGLAANGNGNIASFNAINNGITAVTSTITVTPSGNGCTGAPQTFSITVDPSPSVNDPADQVVCDGAPTTAVTFSGAVAGTTYSWTNNATSIGLAANGTGNIASFNAVNNGTSPVVATITVSTSASSCAGNQQTFTITVNPTPVVTDPVDQVVCNGASTSVVSFSGTVAGTTYSWTNNTTSIGLPANGTGNIAAFTATNSTVSPVVATITVTPTANSCPGMPQNFTITVNPSPTVDDPADQIVCNGAPTAAVTFSGTGTGYTWTNNTTSIGLAASGSGNIASFNAVNNGTTVVTATITVTPTAIGCPGPAQAFTIRVNPTPTVSDPANQTICAGSPTAAVNFTGNAVAGKTYSWVNDNTSIGLAANGTGNISSFTAINGGTTPVVATIQVTPTANGCTGASESFTITVNPSPTLFNLTPGTGTSCPGVIIGLESSQIGVSYRLFRATTGVGASIAGTGSAINFPAQTVAGTYTIRGTLGTCTVVMTGSVILNGVTPGTLGTVTVCEGGSANLLVTGASGSGTLTYQWQSSPNGTTYTNIPFATDANYVTPPLFSGVMYYRRVLTSTLNGVACSATSTRATISISGTSTIETVVAGDWNSTATWGGQPVPGQDDGTLSCPVIVNDNVTLSGDVTIRDGVYAVSGNITDVENSDFDFLSMIRATQGSGGQYKPDKGVLDLRGGTTIFQDGATITNATIIVRNGATLVLGPSTCDVCNCLDEENYDPDACASECTQTRLTIGVKSQIYVEAGGNMIVYGNVLNTNNQGNMTVNGNIYITGNYASSTGNVSITQDVDGTGDLITCGSMTSQGSSTIYGSNIDCPVGPCLASNLKCSHSVNVNPFGFVGYCTGTTLTASSSLMQVDPPPAFTLTWQYNLDGGPGFIDLPDQVNDPVYNWPDVWPHTSNGSDVQAYYRVKVETPGEQGCAVYSFISQVVPGTNRWRGKEEVVQGANPDDWHYAPNWCQRVPLITDDITIGSGSPRVYSGTASVRDLTLNPGVVLSLNSGSTLAVAGNLINDGTINSTTSTVTFSGTGTSSISSPTGTGQFNLHNLGASSGKTLNLPETDQEIRMSGNIVLTGVTFNQGSSTIRINGGGNQTINAAGNNFFNIIVAKTGGGLTISSPLNELGRLDILSNTTVSSGGNLRIRSRGITTDLDGSIGPVAAGASITGDVTVERYMDPLNTQFRYIASPVATTAFPSQLDRLYVYENGAWVRYFGSMANGVGYAGLKYSNEQITWSGTSSVFIGPKTWNFPAEGWYLIGNPYPSAIRWSSLAAAWTLSNISTTIAVTDNSVSGYPNYFRYFQYNSEDPTDWGYGPLQNGVIAMGQAFWIYAGAGGGTLTVREAAKATETGEFYRVDNLKAPDVLAVQITNGKFQDRTFMAIRKGASPEFSMTDDLPKLSTSEMDIYFIDSSNRELVMHGLSEIPDNMKIPIGIEVSEPGEYSLSIGNAEKFSYGNSLYLIDEFDGHSIPVTEVINYSFSVLDPAKSLRNRFYLSRNPEVRWNPETAVAVFPNPVRNELTIHIGGMEDAVRAQMIDHNGKVLHQSVFRNDLTFDMSQIAAGVYLLKLETKRGVFTKKIVKH